MFIPMRKLEVDRSQRAYCCQPVAASTLNLPSEHVTFNVSEVETDRRALMTFKPTLQFRKMNYFVSFL